MIDWGLIRIQYEIFGESAESLAEQFDTSVRLVEYAKKEEGWQVYPIAESLREWKNLDNIEDIPADLLDQVRDRMSILFTLKQSTLNPRYIAIETAILGKAHNIVKSIQPDQPGAASILKAIAEVFTSLREATGMVGKAGVEEDSGGVQVNILTRVEGTREIDGPPVAVQVMKKVG